MGNKSSVYCLSGEKMTIYSLLFIMKGRWEIGCVREGESDRQGTAKIWYLQIYTRWRYISRVSCFFMLLSQETDLPPTPPWASTRNGGIAHCLPLTLLTDNFLWLTADSLKLKTSIVIYFSDAYAILSMQFTWHFHCPLPTLRRRCTPCFKIHKLTNQSKVNM